jgi:hypothetical protein
MIAELPLSWESGVEKVYLDTLGLTAAKSLLTRTINSGVALTYSGPRKPDSHLS